MARRLHGRKYPSHRTEIRNSKWFAVCTFFISSNVLTPPRIKERDSLEQPNSPRPVTFAHEKGEGPFLSQTRSTATAGKANMLHKEAENMQPRYARSCDSDHAAKSDSVITPSPQGFFILRVYDLFKGETDEANMRKSILHRNYINEGVRERTANCHFLGVGRSTLCGLKMALS